MDLSLKEITEIPRVGTVPDNNKRISTVNICLRCPSLDSDQPSNLHEEEETCNGYRQPQEPTIDSPGCEPCVNMQVNLQSDTRSDKDIVLPFRYRRHIRDSSSGTVEIPHSQLNGDCSSGNNCEALENGASESSREKDLSIALAWLRQEIGKLKEQDKALMRQFLELRAVIRSLQENGSHANSFGSGSDITSMSSSAQSLDDDGRLENKGSRSNSLLRGEDYLSEFRGRTVSLLPPKTSLSLSVGRWRSKESF